MASMISVPSIIAEFNDNYKWTLVTDRGDFLGKKLLEVLGDELFWQLYDKMFNETENHTIAYKVESFVTVNEDYLTVKWANGDETTEPVERLRHDLDKDSYRHLAYDLHRRQYAEIS